MNRHLCLAAFMTCFVGMVQCTESDEESFFEKIIDIYTQIDIDDRDY